MIFAILLLDIVKIYHPSFTIGITYFINNPKIDNLTMACFIDVLRPNKFSDAYFKMWQVKATL